MLKNWATANTDVIQTPNISQKMRQIYVNRKFNQASLQSISQKKFNSYVLTLPEQDKGGLYNPASHFQMGAQHEIDLSKQLYERAELERKKQ